MYKNGIVFSGLFDQGFDAALESIANIFENMSINVSIASQAFLLPLNILTMRQQYPAVRIKLV